MLSSSAVLLTQSGRGSCQGQEEDGAFVGWLAFYKETGLRDNLAAAACLLLMVLCAQPECLRADLMPCVFVLYTSDGNTQRA